MAEYEFTAMPTLTSGVVSWQLCVVKPTNQAGCGDGSQDHPYPNVIVAKDHGAATFQFKIISGINSPDVTFKQPPSSSNIGPIWVQATQKPTGPVLNGQIDSPDGKANGHKVLTFKDKNDNTGGPLVLKYQLNFVDQHGTSVNPIDPDITNGGHSFLTPTMILITAAVIAALVSVVVTFVLAPIVARRAIKP